MTPWNGNSWEVGGENQKILHRGVWIFLEPHNGNKKSHVLKLYLSGDSFSKSFQLAWPPERTLLTFLSDLLRKESMTS